MSNNVKALKSGIWYTVANFLTKSIGIITTPIFTRLLTHEEFGLYNNYTSWMAVFTILVTLNLDSTFISARYDFEEKFDEYIFSVLSLSSISAILWGVLLNLFSGFAVERLGMDQIYINCMIVYLLLLPAVTMYQARERYRFGYKKSVLISCLITVGTSLLSVLLVVMMPDRLSGRIFGSALPTILIGLVLYILIARKGKSIRVKYWKYAFPICLPFVPHLLSLTVLNSVDRVMITNICGAEDNALYSLAYTCSSIISILVTSLNTAYSPWLGEKLNENRLEEIKTFSKKYIFIFLGLALGIMLVSPEIILLLGGSSYIEAEYVMPPVMFGCVCQFLYTMFVSVEQFKKKTIGMAVASVSAAGLNYALNVVCIPRFGYIAAAYTTLVSFLWLLIAHMFLVWKMGYQKVYPYGFIIRIVLMMSFVTVGINFLYHVTVLRYLLVLVYFVIFVIVVYRNKDKVIMLLKRKKS